MTLLVCLDETKTAPRVLHHAVAFGKASGLDLFVIRVLDPRIDVTQGGDDSETVIASAVASLEEQLFDELTRAGGTGRVSVPVLEPRQPVQQAIVRAAEQAGAQAIIMGSHGAGLLRHTVLGSVAMGVVGSAPCPVLVLGPRSADQTAAGGGYTMLIADDASQGSKAVMEAMRPLLSAAKVRPVLLHLYEPRLGDDGEIEETRRAMERLEADREALPNPELATCIVRRLPDFERTDAAILRTSKELGVQAIAMATKGYTARQHIVSGSVAVGVLKNSPLPVLLVRRA